MKAAGGRRDRGLLFCRREEWQAGVEAKCLFPEPTFPLPWQPWRRPRGSGTLPDRQESSGGLRRDRALFIGIRRKSSWRGRERIFRCRFRGREVQGREEPLRACGTVISVFPPWLSYCFFSAFWSRRAAPVRVWTFSPAGKTAMPGEEGSHFPKGDLSVYAGTHSQCCFSPVGTSRRGKDSDKTQDDLDCWQRGESPRREWSLGTGGRTSIWTAFFPAPLGSRFLYFSFRKGPGTLWRRGGERNKEQNASKGPNQKNCRVLPCRKAGSLVPALQQWNG